MSRDEEAYLFITDYVLQRARAVVDANLLPIINVVDNAIIAWERIESYVKERKQRDENSKN